jgi:hypothetical protein
MPHRLQIMASLSIWQKVAAWGSLLGSILPKNSVRSPGCRQKAASERVLQRRELLEPLIRDKRDVDLRRMDRELINLRYSLIPNVITQSLHRLYIGEFSRSFRTHQMNFRRC